MYISKQIVLSLLYLHLYFSEAIIHGHLLASSIFVEENMDIWISDVGTWLNLDNIPIEEI